MKVVLIILVAMVTFFSLVCSEHKKHNNTVKHKVHIPDAIVKKYIHWLEKNRPHKHIKHIKRFGKNIKMAKQPKCLIGCHNVCPVGFEKKGSYCFKKNPDYDDY